MKRFLEIFLGDFKKTRSKVKTGSRQDRTRGLEILLAINYTKESRFSVFI